MQKFLRTLLLTALFVLPFAATAQNSAERTRLSEDFSVANPEGWTYGSGQMPTLAATGNANGWLHTDMVYDGLAAGHYYNNLYAKDRYEWLISPEISLADLEKAELTFKLALTKFGGGAPDTISPNKKVMVLMRQQGTTGSWGSWSPLRTWVKNPEEGQLALSAISQSYENDTIDLTAYVNKTVQVAFYVENTDNRAGSLDLHVDDVYVKGQLAAMPVADLAVSEYTTNTVTLTWNKGENVVIDHYEIRIDTNGVATQRGVVVSPSATYTFTGLEPATNYAFSVRAFVTPEKAGAWSSNVTVFTHYATVITIDGANPYFNDFEDSNLEGWTIVNDTHTLTNGWYIGTEAVATHLDSIVCSADSTGAFIFDTVWKANTEHVFPTDIDSTNTVWKIQHTVVDGTNNRFWISDDGGITNHYTRHTSTTYYSYAYITVALEAGQYNIGFDWRCKGESASWESLNLYMANENAAPQPGQTLVPSSWSAVVTGLWNKDTWQEYYKPAFNVAEAGIYHFVFYWKNDGVNNQPPAAFDNLTIKKVVCFPITELEIVEGSMTAHTATLSWADENEVGSYRVIARSSKDTVLSPVVTLAELPYVMSGLSFETSYTFSVITVCGEGNESNPSATAVATTLPACYPVTDLEAETTRGSVTLTWVDTINTGDMTYTAMVIRGTDTIKVENAESGVVIDGLLHSTEYTAIVVAANSEDKKMATTSFMTECAEIVVVPAKTYTIFIDDQYGGGYCDGWNNNYLQAYVDGVQVGGNMTMTSSDCPSKTFEVVVPEGSALELKYVAAGSYQSENSVIVYDNNGNAIFTAARGSLSSNATIFTETAVTDGSSIENCHNPVMTITVGDRTLSTAAFSWEQPLQNEEADHFVVVVKNAITGAEVISTEVEDMEYTATDLNPSTVYVAEVTAVCEDGYTLKGTAQFETFGPCNAPINFVATPGLTTINLAWEQEDASVETYKLLVSETAVTDLAAVDAAEFIAVNGNNGYTVQDLEPSTTYYLYFFANCGSDTSAIRDAIVTTEPAVDCTIEVTVASNATSNEYYLPVYTFYTDNYTRSQSVYPASMLTELVGKSITSLHYYVASTNNNNWLSNKFYVKVAEVEEENLANGFDLTTQLTTVAVYNSNELTASVADGMTIVFDEPFVYNGGNLLIEFSNPETKSGYSQCKFYYESGHTNASRYANSSSSFSSISSTGTVKNYLPKVTFGVCAEKDPNVCVAIDALEVSDIDYNTATLSWEHPDCHVEGYQLLLSDIAVSDFTGLTFIELNEDVTMYVATLAPNAAHYAYVRSICGTAAGDTTAWATASFNTPAFCRVAQNLTVELTAKNAIHAAWEGTSSTQAAHYQYILDTIVLTADSLANYPANKIVGYIDTTLVDIENLDYATTYYMYVRNMCELQGVADPAPWFGPVSITTIKEMTDVKNLAADVYRNEITATWEADSANFATDSMWRVAIALKDSTPETWQTVNVPTVTFDNLEYDSVYTVFVAAFNGTITSDTVQVDATTDKAMPAVINLAASVYRNEITATWESDSIHNAIDTAWSVAIALKDSVPTEWQTVNERTVTFAGLEFDSTYTVYVVALYGEMASDTVSVDATCGEAMPKVINLATSVYRNEISASWERDSIHNAIETQWKVSARHSDDDSTALNWITVDSMGYTFTNLDYNTNYTIRVIAVLGEMESDTVKKANVKTHIAMPAVTGVTVSNLSHNYAKVSWNSAAEGIEQQWAFGFKKDADSVYAWTMINHRDTMIYGLDELTTYNVRIAAVMDNLSSDSVNVNFTTMSKASALSSCATIANGTTTNSYAPVYGNWMDASQHNQIVYPAEMLTELVGKPIQSMKFFVQSGSSTSSWSGTTWHTQNFTFKMGETNVDNLSSGFVADATQTVYEGSIDAVNTTNGMVVNFTTPFTYTGGNLVIDITTVTNGAYASASFYGINPGKATVRYSYSTTNSTQNFLPKVEFCYEGQYIQNLAVENITENSAEASWMPGGHESEWQYVNAEGKLTAAELEAAEKTTVTTQSVALTGLTVDKDYTFYIRSHEVGNVYEYPMVVSKIDSIFDTTYSKTNPMEIAQIDTILDTTWVNQMDVTIGAALDSMIAATDTAWKPETNHIVPTDIDSINTVWTITVRDTIRTVHVDTIPNQDIYSDWCSVSYATLAVCAEPTRVAFAGAVTDSAMVYAQTEASALNFRYAVKGSDEYITVAGIDSVIYDTTDVEYVYDPEDMDTTYYGYDSEYNYVEQSEPFDGYNGDTYDYETPVTSFNVDIAEGAEPIDTVYTIDTFAFFYAYLTPLTANTTYVFDAQSVCGEGNESRWTGNREFTTHFYCGNGVDLPYTENFDGATEEVYCWTVVAGENEPVFEGLDSLEANIYNYSSQYRLFPADAEGDHAYIPHPDSSARYNRYVISPAINGTDETPLYWTSSMMVNTYNYGVNDYSDDSVAFGYSTTNDSIENFTWTEFRSHASSSNTYSWNNVESLPAGVKYIAYHFVGSKPDWMALNNTTIRALETYNVKAYNNEPENAHVYFVVDGDTLTEAASYDENIVETSTAVLRPAAENGFRFANWYTTDNTGKHVTINTTNITVNADTILVANFVRNNNTVKVAINDAAAGTAKMFVNNIDTNNAVYAHGTMITLVANDTNSGDHKSFRGWSPTANANNIVSYDATYEFPLNAATNNATQTFTAIYVKDSFEVVVDYNPVMGTVTGDGAQVLTATNSVHLTATPNYGYEFVRWNDVNGDSLTTNTTVDTASVDSLDLHFTAMFQTIPFYVQVASNDLTLGTATASADEAQFLDTITFTATPVAEHYHFRFWRDNFGNEYYDNPYDYEVHSDLNMIAFFAIDSHYVKAISDVENYGYVTINGEQTDSAIFAYGTENVVLNAVANTGVQFTNWSDGVETANRTLALISKDTILTANFDSIDYNFVVRFEATEGNAYDVAADSALLDSAVFVKHYGNIVRLAAAPVTGYRFANWTDDMNNVYTTDTIDYEIADRANQVITANFVEVGKVNMTLLANNLSKDSVAGTVLGMGTYNNTEKTTADWTRFDSNAVFTMTATAKDHYHFVNWVDAEGNVVATEAETEITTEGLAMQFTANFEIDTHNVKATGMNGSFMIAGIESDSIYVNYGDTVIVVPEADEHYHFLAWVDGTVDTNRTIAVVSDTTVAALFEIDTVLINASVNNEAMGTVTVTEGYKSAAENGYWYNYGDNAKMYATANTGFHFVNWSTQAETDTIEVPVYSAYTYVANFDTNVYNVEFVAENGTIAGPATIKHFTTAEYVATANYGYHFTGWLGVESENDTATLSAVSDTTITALFAKNSYVVAGVANYDSLGTVTGTDTVLYQDTVTLIATAIEGYHVASWSNGMTGDTIKVVADSNITVTANFAINVYNVTVNAGENGTATASHQVNHGTVDTLIATANYGYELGVWSTGATTDTIIITVVSDTTVGVSFVKTHFTAAAQVNDATMGTAIVSNNNPLYEDTVVFTATAADGYHFVSWSNGDTTAVTSVVITRDTILTATFEADPILTAVVTLVSADATMGSVSNGGTVEIGTQFTATATPNNGYEFVAWMNGNDTVSNSATYTFTVTEDITLVAHFQAQVVSYTVTLASNNDAWGTVSGGGTFTAGQTCTAIATANSGYHFVEWRNGTQVVSTSAEYTFTVTANISLTAVFAQGNGIDDIDMSDVTIYSTDSKIIVRGAENQSIYIYDVNGRVITHEQNAGETMEYRMATTGVYLVKVGNAPAKRVIVVR